VQVLHKRALLQNTMYLEESKGHKKTLPSVLFWLLIYYEIGLESIFLADYP
jgi:hypothetical protein